VTDSTFSAEVTRFETMMRDYINDICPAANGVSCVMPDLRFGTAEPTPQTTSPTAKPTNHPVVPGLPSLSPSPSPSDSPTMAPSARPVDPGQILEIVGQLTLKGRYDTLRQWMKANGVEPTQFGMDVMTFVIGQNALSEVTVSIISVFRGSPNVVIEYKLSSPSSFAVDNAVRSISLQIASGAVYSSDGLSFPIFANQVISGEEHISAAAATVREESDDSGSTVGIWTALVVIAVALCFCGVVAALVWCVRSKKRRDREIKAMAAMTALPEVPRFVEVNSDDMPFKTGKRGYHAVVPSWDLGLSRLTPAFQGMEKLVTSVDRLDLEAESGDETRNQKATGSQLILPADGQSH